MDGTGEVGADDDADEQDEAVVAVLVLVLVLAVTVAVAAAVAVASVSPSSLTSPNDATNAASRAAAACDGLSAFACGVAAALERSVPFVVAANLDVNFAVVLTAGDVALIFGAAPYPALVLVGGDFPFGAGDSHKLVGGGARSAAVRVVFLPLILRRPLPDFA